jgi:hypothetical protein
MTKEEIAKCKVGDEVEYLAGYTVDGEFQKFKGRVAIIRKIEWPPFIEIPGEISPRSGNKIWSTSWSRLRYVEKKQRQLTFVFTE